MSYKMETWNYSHLFEDGSKKRLDKYAEEIVSDIEKFSSYREKLDSLSTEDFTHMMKLSEEIESKENRLLIYLHLREYANSDDSEATALKSKYVTQLTEAGNKMVFFVLWFQKLDEEKAQEYIQAVPDHAYSLELTRKNKPHTLSEKEEQLMNTLSPFSMPAIKTMRSQLVSDFTFDFDKDHMEITQEELHEYRTSKNKKERHRCYELEYAKYGEFSKILNEIYKTAAMKWDVVGTKVRNHPSPLAYNTFGDDIDEKTIQTLLDVCQKHTHLVQKHMRLKARALGEKKLHRHDLYAPVGKDDETKYTYDEAVHMTLDVYKNFDSEMANFAQQVFDNGMIDAAPRKGKRSGAFCMPTLPEMLPYLMLNFTGTFEDISTMTHEMGHGIHHCLASKNNNIVNNDAVIPLAETASTFGETALIEHVLKTANDEQKFVIYDQLLKDFYCTVFRQAFFVIFEQRAHEAYMNGADMHEVAEIYYNTLKEQFGDTVELPEHFKNEYTMIPHIVSTPFYCAGYSFGHIFSVAMYGKYKEEGDSFIPKVKKVMELGGSMKPANIVKTAGFDINTEDFWESGFKFYERMLNEYEELLNERNL